ncbi:hypothetical protein Fmac_023449 [Flemingia macrophylla]|uniref:40S ribosomal protein S15 n=1 Tax=Flemingia macrophylla TaxID=520843 RepID=A0ABD1LLM4_9FABA
MTNEVFQINWPTRNGCEVRNVLVRLYGEGVEVFFDREEEVRTFECMSKHGQGPRLLGRFTSDRVEEFINARPLLYSLMYGVLNQTIVSQHCLYGKRDAPPGEKPEPICTHLRNMIIMPEMIGSIIGVYNGKTFNQVEIKPEMIGHYLAEFSISYKPVKHGRLDFIPVMSLNYVQNDDPLSTSQSDNSRSFWAKSRHTQSSTVTLGRASFFSLLRTSPPPESPTSKGGVPAKTLRRSNQNTSGGEGSTI